MAFGHKQFDTPVNITFLHKYRLEKKLCSED